MRALAKVGFVRSGQRGSPVKLRHDDGRVAIVPLHNGLARGTLRSVLRQAGISPEEFVALLSWSDTIRFLWSTSLVQGERRSVDSDMPVLIVSPKVHPESAGQPGAQPGWLAPWKISCAIRARSKTPVT